MSYDQPPSVAGSGWTRATPRLSSPASGSSTPRSGTFSSPPLGPSGISWAVAKAKSDEVKSYPSFSTRNSGFFSRQKRKISARIPSLRIGSSSSAKDYDYKNAYGYGSGDETWTHARHAKHAHSRPAPAFWRSVCRRRGFRMLLVLVLGWITYLCFQSGMFASLWLIGPPPLFRGHFLFGVTDIYGFL